MKSVMYKILKMEGRAKRAHMETVHGNIETPVFMNVGTAAAIKGAVSTEDLQQIGTQVELSNTYHLHVRPGDEVVKKIKSVRRSGLTFAPEAGSQRLRDVINKNITEEAIFKSCKIAFEGGYCSVKLYFMLGLPTETLDDI